MVLADRYMLSGILRNLLSNAIKFTERGGTITLSTSGTEEQFIFTIEDTGTGNNSKKLSQLFTLDCRGSSGTEGEPSSGLGLTIVKDFVEKHGGTVLVSSTINQGTTFTVKLPRNR